jgi:2-succinyl-6-hydroxy-2,4-cyclohexadiene-1-carboxylate synthase
VKRVEVDGVQYAVAISGTGPGLLLLHGFTGSGASWRPHLAAMRDQHTTIRVDLLGHGLSDAPADTARHALERQAADLAQLIRRLKIGRVDVVGYSFGARMALALALLEPALVRRLVLESASAGIADPTEREARRRADNALADDIERDGIPAFVERWESLPLFASHAALPEATSRRLHDQRLRNSATGLAGSLRGAGQGTMTPLHDRLRAIRVPALVVVGADDPARARAEFVAEHIPGAVLATVPCSGHTPHLESPARFRAIVLPFLTATSPEEKH